MILRLYPSKNRCLREYMNGLPSVMRLPFGWDIMICSYLMTVRNGEWGFVFPPFPLGEGAFMRKFNRSGQRKPMATFEDSIWYMSPICNTYFQMA